MQRTRAANIRRFNADTAGRIDLCHALGGHEQPAQMRKAQKLLSAAEQAVAVISKRLMSAECRNHLLAEQPDRAHQIALWQIGKIELSHEHVEDPSLCR
jgi:hypothetical protein